MFWGVVHSMRSVAYIYMPSLSQTAMAQIWDSCAKHSPRVEPDQENGVFVDFASTHEAIHAAQGLLRDALGLDQAARAVLAANRLAAKAGVLVGRPTGARPFWVIDPGTVTALVANWPVSVLWMAPAKVRERLHDLGVATWGDLARAPVAQLAHHFGPLAAQLRQWSLGFDHSPIRPAWPPRQVAWKWCDPAHGLADRRALEARLAEGAGALAKQLARYGKGCRRLRLTVQFERQQQAPWAAERHLSQPSADAGLLGCVAAQLCAALPVHRPVSQIDLTGLELTRMLEPAGSLFSEPASSEADRRTMALERVVSPLTRRFGPSALQPAARLTVARRLRVLELLGASGRDGA